MGSTFFPGPNNTELVLPFIAAQANDVTCESSMGTRDSNAPVRLTFSVVEISKKGRPFASRPHNRTGRAAGIRFDRRFPIPLGMRNMVTEGLLRSK